MTRPQREEKAAKVKSGVAQAIDLYHDLFLAKFGFKPIISGGKDGAQMKRLIGTWGTDEVLGLLRKFFSTTDPRVTRCRDYSITDFAVLAQHLRMGQRPSQREAENIDAAARATGRRS